MSGPAARRRDDGPEGLAVFRRILRLVGIVEKYLATAAFGAVVTVNCLEVGLRFTVRYSLWWNQEVSLLMMLVAYFFGASYVFKTRQYIAVDFIVTKLPGRLQIGLYHLAQALAAVLTGVILYQSIALAPSQMNFSTFILGIPKFYSALPLLIAAASILATSIYYSLAVHRAASRRGAGATLADIEDQVLVLKRPVPA